MKIEINVEKKHLVVFSVFLVLVSSLLVLAWDDSNPPNNPGHSADTIGGGMIDGSLTVHDLNTAGACAIDPSNGAETDAILYVENSGSDCDYDIKANNIFGSTVQSAGVLLTSNDNLQSAGTIYYYDEIFYACTTSNTCVVFAE